MVQGGADDHGVLPIVQLVRETVAASGKSLRVFSTERRIAYSTLRYYHDKRRRPLSQPPRQETLRELALALGLPLSDVEQAALESLSYRAAPPKQEARPPDVSSPPESGSIEAAIDADPHLHPAAKAHLQNQLELLRLIPPGIPIPSTEQERRRQIAIADAEAERLAKIARAATVPIDRGKKRKS